MKTVGCFLKSSSPDIVPILSLALQKNPAKLWADADEVLEKSQQKRISQLIEKRKNGVPFAYLSGERGFYHLNFAVSPAVLIPRPETERLVDIALDLLDGENEYEILDLGTGSGAIAAVLADKRPRWKISAGDICPQALEIARKNAPRKIDFRLSDGFEKFAGGRFDLIITNPPYIAENDPHLKMLKHEPKRALIGGKDGLALIRRIVDEAGEYLKKDGWLLLEHGFDQQKKILRMMRRNYKNIRTFKDYNALDRAILAQANRKGER